MSESLFRTEVLQARRQGWLGPVSLDQPPMLRWIGMIALLAAFGVGFGLVRGEYTRRTAVSGLLAPSMGVATVVAPVAGVVTRVGVEEGQRVLGGMSLAIIAIPNATSAGGTGDALARSLAVRRAAIAAARAALLARLGSDERSTQAQRDLARIELDRAEDELGTRRRQKALAESTAARHRALFEQRYVTALQLQQQEAVALEQAGAVHMLERQTANLRRQLAQFDQALGALPAQFAQAEADAARELAFVDQEETQLQARRDAVVESPLAGRVAVLLVQPGQTVQPGQPLLTMLPASSRLEAHLLVPGHALSGIAPGDRVLLRYAAFPFQKFGQHGGRVERVSDTALPATEPGAEPLFRVVVTPDRQYVGTRPLRPGQRLDAHVLGERRRLWEWVVEPLQTLRATAVADARWDRSGATQVTGGSDSSAEAMLNPGTRHDGALPAGPANRPTEAKLHVSPPACATPWIREASATSGDTASLDVGIEPMAADPGAKDVLRSPANGGRATGACDA